MAMNMKGRGKLHIFDKNLSHRLVLQRVEDHDASVSPTAFARGACREAFKCRIPSLDPTATFVAKKYFKSGVNTEQELENDFIQAHIAADFANKFNEYNPPKKIRYIIPHMILELFGTKYTIEPMLDGPWQKHNNIFGWCESQRCTPAAFAHFTYVASGGSMMVLDVQGVGDYYTDPAVCTRDRRFGFTDFGPQGFDEFRKVHQCNDVCKHIGLDHFVIGVLPTGPLPPPKPKRSHQSSPTQPISTSPAHNNHSPAGRWPNSAPAAVSPLPPVGSPSASGDAVPPPRAFRRDNTVLQEIYGDVLSTSDSIALCAPADIQFDEGMLYQFKQKFGGIEELRSQDCRVGNVVYQTRRTRFIYYLLVKPTASSPTPRPSDVKEAIEALQRHMKVNGVKRLSIPRSLGLGADGYRWQTVRGIIWEVFGGQEVTISMFNPCSGKMPSSSGHSNNHSNVRSSSHSNPHAGGVPSPVDNGPIGVGGILVPGRRKSIPS